jgi:hypothetical protein
MWNRCERGIASSAVEFVSSQILVIESGLAIDVFELCLPKIYGNFKFNRLHVPVASAFPQRTQAIPARG